MLFAFCDLFSRSQTRVAGTNRLSGLGGASTGRPAKRRHRLASAGIGLERLEDRVTPSCDCYANLFAGPRLVSVDSNQSAVLQGVFNSLLPGSYVNLTVLDWNAIANAGVNLSSYFTALEARLGVSTPAEAL